MTLVAPQSEASDNPELGSTARGDASGSCPAATAPDRRWSGFLRRPVWHRFTPLQTLVLAIASVPPALICWAVGSRLLGFTTHEEMLDLALGAGENPGTIVFGAMFMASPVQWLTGRSQVRVRKFLGIVFYLLALSNGAMFAIEEGIGQALSSPFLIAGTVAVALGLPLFLTSSTWAQRTMGMRRWRLLHKATYGVAAAILAHVVLIGEIDLGSALITLGFVLRMPPIRGWLQAKGSNR